MKVAESPEAREDADSQLRANCLSGTAKVDQRREWNLAPCITCESSYLLAFPSACVILTVLWVGFLRNQLYALDRPNPVCAPWLMIIPKPLGLTC